jgi:N-acetylneuraminic acid mutarotase
MNTSCRISAPTGYRLSLLLTTGLAILGCREDAATPSEPEAQAAALPLAQAPNTWIARAPIARPHSDFAVGAAPNSAGQWFTYIFGGQDRDGTGFGSERYNVETNSWGSANAFINAANLNGVGRIGNKLYLTGGESSGDVNFRTFNTTWVYDISSNKLFTGADVPRATKYGVTGVINGKLYVLAGWCSGESVDPGHCIVGSPVKQFYRYDPATNTWINRRQPPHIHQFAGGAVINGKFYVVGDCCGDSRTALDVYDPVTNTWTTRASIPATGERYSAAVIQNRLFVLLFTHVNGAAVVKAYSYDPATNTWRTKAAPPFFAQIVRVQLGGQARLFLPGSSASYLYAP